MLGDGSKKIKDDVGMETETYRRERVERGSYFAKVVHSQTSRGVRYVNWSDRRILYDEEVISTRSISTYI